MTSTDFIIAEGAASNQKSLKILVRFIRSLTLLRRIFPFAFVLMLTATAAPQVFLWLIGLYSQCSDRTTCRAPIPFVGESFALNPTFLCVLAAVASFLRVASWAVFEIAGQWASRGIHASMVNSVARTRTTFFDENPSGRLINRLVRDFDNLRTTGIVRIGDSINCLLEVLCIAALILLAHPIGALLVIPTLLLFFYLQSQISPMLQRCATFRSVRLSDVLHRETDLIEGTRTFLLYGKEAALLTRLQTALSGFIQIHFGRARIESWGRFWTSSITSLYGFCALSVVAFAVHGGTISKVFGAVIITVIFRMSPLFNWFTWTTGYLIESIATARRVFEYVDLKPEEEEERARPTTEIFSARVPSSYPDLSSSVIPNGDIEFVEFAMSYRAATPIILEHLNLTLPAGKSIGIVGRTGAGKTSLVQSLYRMVYVRNGDIRIGGRSIFDFSIDAVRSHFGVVPQDPYLFAGTLQSNLDRSRALPVPDLERALAKVGLPLPVNFVIEEGGRNLSLGERQLVCLARVILMNRPVILMDEPTSSVDTITDQKMQEFLSKELRGHTVIAIAHRLETLSRYDLIIEMKAGHVERVGTPHDLIGSLSERDLL